MARYEGRITAQGAEALEIDELLTLFAQVPPSPASPIEHARACYLSSSDGWRDALQQLGGAFAEGEARLTVPKEE